MIFRDISPTTNLVALAVAKAKFLLLFLVIESPRPQKNAPLVVLVTCLLLVALVTLPLVVDKLARLLYVSGCHQQATRPATLLEVFAVTRQIKLGQILSSPPQRRKTPL